MSWLIMASVFAVADPAYPVCNAEVCPERRDDFVWENDKFGMRAYGPRDVHRWSGLDVFNKNTASNVCLMWCHRLDKGNFHKNRGEGMDNYTVGPGRGVGAVALLADGEWKTYPNWETSRVVRVGADVCEFELVYPAFSAAGRMTYHITLKRGERFFRNDVTFEREMPATAVVGPALDIDPARGHGGSLAEADGVVSLFEDPKGADGSTMTAVFVAPDERVERLTDQTGCRVLGFRGRRSFTYWAGASWSLAGEIVSADAWHEHVKAFRAGLVAAAAPAKGLDAQLVRVRSTYDGSLQPCYFWAPKDAKAVPLIVGLHTWSGDWRQIGHYKTVLAYAKAHGWAMVGPNFRGANRTPEACGSDAAVQDIVDAVAYAKAHADVDPRRVFIAGGSGGGHMTLLMAGRHPELWAGCAAFCPITDLARWHADSLLAHPGRGKAYARMMEASCGGTPETKPEEYAHRSPLTYLAAARQAGVPVYIATGIHDGWRGSVPVGHAFRAFNALADEKDRVSEADIALIEENQKVPDALAFVVPADPFYGQKMRIHFRRTSANVRLTLFEGGHAGNYPAGFDFFSRQTKGKPADFSLPAKGRGAAEALAK